MEHYVCKGTCGGVSEVPGVCQTEGCPRQHAPLEKCECTDGHHAMPQGAAENREEEKK